MASPVLLVVGFMVCATVAAVVVLLVIKYNRESGPTQEEVAQALGLNKYGRSLSNDRPLAGQGALLANLPVEDLQVKRAGAWNGSVSMKKSKVVNFQGQPALKVLYEKGSGTSSHRGGVGGVIIHSVPQTFPRESAIIEFQVFFAEGWQWSKGGKIGGFFIGHGQASGKAHSDTGSSHRFTFGRDGEARSYVYLPSNLAQDPSLRQTGPCKDCGVSLPGFSELFKAGTLKIGQWNVVKLGVRLNSFDREGRPEANGHALLYVNGTTGTATNVRWRRSPDLKISAFTLNTFFGGPDPATTDCTAYFRNFKLFSWA